MLSEKTKEKKKEEPSSVFQRQRVDVLLGELAKKFPLKPQNQAPIEKQGIFLCIQFMSVFQA
jgi:hypothetical protein